MAFLLDIITFLQISFSTNIFRINYINDAFIFSDFDNYTVKKHYRINRL
ncbi:50S rRNA methyltransferase, partial [Francisella tularensis]|nr:50S rRNA methyltransferase [Francisella tularensis]NDI66633.1 50S rRNA methyltransferase [Francisella tularensis subsp. holarctica]MBF6994931.1 50S rRNA methyltransferase [Francisella tularensis]MBF6996323.1 50S rRNA methyltransferase [Francisella tularensis]MBF6998209.1 50S rRNA methyltransferase [Francisella tularensis]